MVICFALAIGPMLVSPAPAADPDKPDSSLKWIPADAAFYSATLRNREQVEAVAKSRAWAKLQSLPAVQAAWKMVQAEYAKPEGKLAEFRKFYEQPENQQLAELIGDMFSHEFFLYGGADNTGLINLFMQFNGARRFAPLLKWTAQGKELKQNERDLQVTTLLAILSENLDLIKTPELIVGFKLSDPKRAEAQLKRLEILLQGLVNQNPQLQGRLKRAKVGEGSFLTLTLDGEMVPWQQIPFRKYEDKPGEYDALLKKLTQLKLTVSVGVRDGYLLVALGESTDVLARLGRGKRLIDRAEMKPLARFADKPLTAVSYVSKDLRARMTLSKKDLDEWAGLAKEALQRLELTAEQRKRIDRDIDRLAKDLKAFIPEAGAMLMFAFLTERGQESYTYDWAENAAADGSKPLTLLNHVGGTPLLAFVGRSKSSTESYQMLVRWLKAANGYFEELVVPKLDDDQKTKYEQFAKAFHPLLRRLDEATGKMLLPALRDGQAGLVLDGKLTSRQWFQALPMSDKPLPVVEPALVVGVSDSDLLKQAFAEYRSIVNEAIAKARELAGADQLEFEVPPPKTRKLKAGALYFYPLPPKLGLDRRLVPNAAVSDKVAALTISQEHAERLLADTPLKSGGGPLAKAGRPLATAVYVDWAGMVDVLAPWADWGVQFAQPFWDRPGEGQADPSKEFLKDLPKQVRTVFEVLKVLRSYSSATYFENGVWITHGELVIRDL